MDSRRALLDAVPGEYRRGFAFSAVAAGELVREVAAELRGRLPGPDVTPQQLQPVEPIGCYSVIRRSPLNSTKSA